MIKLIFLSLIILIVYCVRRRIPPKLVFMRLTLYVKLILIRLHIL